MGKQIPNSSSGIGAVVHVLQDLDSVLVTVEQARIYLHKTQAP